MQRHVFQLGVLSLSYFQLALYQERLFCSKKSACGSREDLTKLKACVKILGSFPESTPPGRRLQVMSKFPPRGGRPEKMNAPALDRFPDPYPYHPPPYWRITDCIINWL